jgi:signal transduction histidine kinase
MIQYTHNGQFVSRLTHAIFQPLHNIRSLAVQLPSAGPLTDDQAQLLGQVIKLNSDLCLLINDLLALEQSRRIATDEVVGVPLHHLVESAIHTYSAEIERRGQQLITRIPNDISYVAGHREGLGRAIAALLDNAIKYSPRGARIIVTVTERDRGIAVAVRDTGPGLSLDELEQVFEPFYRAPSTKSLNIPGRGLGLTIAKAVIEQHGGRIWAASTPGHGSTFVFYVPHAPLS